MCAAGVKRGARGSTVRELIEEQCGGWDGAQARVPRYLPGGARAGILPTPRRLAILHSTFDTRKPHGCFFGSGLWWSLHRDDMEICCAQLAEIFRRRILRSMHTVSQGVERSGSCSKKSVGRRPACAILPKLCGASICGWGRQLQIRSVGSTGLSREFSALFAPRARVPHLAQRRRTLTL